MQHKKLIIGLLVVALISCVVIFGKPYKHPKPMISSQAAEQTFDPEVLAIRDKLFAKNKEYGAKTKRQTQLQAEIESLAADKIELEKSAASYDAVLCNEFDTVYTRPNAVALSGSLLTGCDFQ